MTPTMSCGGTMSEKKNRIEQYYIGQSVELKHKITTKDLEQFAKLTGDYNPLHMDDEYARQQLFGKRICHGMLTAAFISTVIGEKLPGHGALWYEQTLRFIFPVYVGETLHIIATVKHIAYTQNVLILKTEILNQDKQLVLSGEASVKLLQDGQNPFLVELYQPPPPQNTAHKINPPSNRKIENRAIIITGATGGIGSQTAKLLAKKAYPLILQYHTNENRAMALAQEIESLGSIAIPVKANLANDHETQNIIKLANTRIGGIFGIIHTAAPLIEMKSLIDMHWTDFQKQLDIQVKGAFNLINAALPIMTATEGGSIVNVISTVTHNIPPEKWAAYTLAKTALLSLTRAFANELGPKGIRVNAVSPGMTATEMIAKLPERTKLVAKMQSPLRKIADASEIAEVIDFLMGHSARHITGENIQVCGGSVMR